MMGAKTLPKAYAAPGLVMRDDAGVLADVMLDPVQVAVWDRHSPLDQQVVQLACREKLAVKSWLDVADLPASMKRSLPGEVFAPLREDLALLADMMACLFGATGVGLRVTALEKPMCPRFHVDRIPCACCVPTVAQAASGYRPRRCLPVCWCRVLSRRAAMRLIACNTSRPAR